MRHGTTVWNEKGFTQGRSNNRLSESGKKLTQEVANNLKNTKIDVIISSPLMRTIQTANIINKYHNVPIIRDDRLTEIDQGVFTGRHKDSLTEEEKILKSTRSRDAKMETYPECFDRMKNFLANIKDDYKYENILIVTHSCNATFIEDILQNKEIDFTDITFLRNFKNAEVKKFVI